MFASGHQPQPPGQDGGAPTPTVHWDQLTDEEASAYSGGKIWEDGFNVQDGQGIPDTFVGHGRPSPETTGSAPMLVLGVGVCTGKTVDEWASAHFPALTAL